MKKLNLIEWLWKTDSHEKQKPQRFARYAAILIMLLTLGVGQMWADNAVTVYCAINASTMKSGDNCYTLKVNANIGDGGTWRQYTMNIVDKTKNGKLIYSATIYEKYGGVDALQFQLYQGSTWKAQKQPYSSWTTSSTFSGKMYDYDAGSWGAYSSLDAATTVYFVNTSSWGTPKAFAWSGCTNNAAWSGQTMTSTGKTYNGKTIYSISFNKRFENIIFSNNGSSQTADQTLGSTNAGKMYDNGTWRTYNYDVTVSFNLQGHGSAIASKTVVKGSKVTAPSDPSASGYTFGGWYKEAGCTNAWNFSSDAVSADTELFAKWTENMSTVSFVASPTGKGTFKVGGSTVTSTTAGVTTTRSVTAVPISGYHFVSWSITGGASISSTTTNPTTVTGGGAGTAATLTATFEADAVNSLTVEAGTHVTTVTGSTSPVTLGNKYAINATAFETGWQFLNWTATPAANGVFDNASSASTNVTVKNGSVVVTANAQEKMTTVTVNVNPASTGTLTVGGATFTPGNTTTAGVATSRTVVATPQPGYRFTGWTATNCNVTSTSSASTTLSGDGTSGDATLVANFARTYAYLEGRMTVYNEERNSETHTASTKGGWDESSTRIEMEYDETNHRFYRHTYKTPAELKAQISSQDQWFSVKTGTVHNSFASGTVKAYHPSSNTNIATAGTKYSAPTTATTYNFKFTNTATDGYAIIYFDEAGVWYELEQSLKYDANGGSGDAPTPTYYLRGTNATAASNPFTARKNYTFAGWNTAADITGTSYAAGASVPMSADRILYAKWNRSVTLDQQDATTPGSTSVTATWNCSTLPSITNPQKLGYEFGGWYTETAGNGNIIINTSGQLQANKTNWTVSGGKFQRTPSSDASESKPLYAKWMQTVTLNANTDHHGSAGGTATIVYNATAKSSITHCTPATGYHLVGYYTAATDGVKVLNADGSFASSAVTDYITDGKWTKAGATTLYAHYEANTYTIAFDPNDANYVGEATGTTASIDATYGVSYSLTANGFSREGYTFAGWATSPTGAKVYNDGQSVSNLTSTNGATVTLYAKWTGTTYTVTFNARGGSDLSINSKPVTMGSAYGELATVTPPAGYVFDGWYTSAGGGTKVTSATQVTTAVDHTLYARYIQKAQVYFKNTFGWSKVYVVYDANWDGTQGTGSEGKIYREMTKVAGTSDVYYDDIPDEYITSWRWNIAFNNTYQNNYHAFTSGEAVFRYDFDKKATMFVPTSNTGSTADGNYTKNGVQYRSTGYKDGTGSNPEYTSGYWRTYNNTYSGYTMTYQKKDGPWSSGHKMESSSVSSNVFIYTVHMDANSQYNFAFYKERDVNTKSVQFCYDHNTQITSNNCTNLVVKCEPQNSWMQTTVEGDYVFKLEMKNDGHMYLTVIYPLAVGDFRVRYNYTNGSAKTYYSEIIKGRANGKDTISIFIHSKDSASSRSLTVEKCTGISSGTPTWNTSYLTVTSKLPAATTAGGKTSGVYDFIITQNGSKEIILDNFSYWKQYTGNYYIRTDVSDGGWDLYKYRTDNIMTLSEYSLTQTLSPPYSHYYCRFIGSAGADITYCIATDYSPNISGTMIGDGTIGGVGNRTLPATANVRFTWNMETNALRRAYLKNAQNENERFLVLHGKVDDNIFNNDASGTAIAADPGRSLQKNELLFEDLGNWIYQVELKAKPNAAVSLIAKYNNADRYLIGSASSWMTIMGGSGSAKYEILAVYDFKTNRLMTVWKPSGDITQTLSDVDVLLIRHAQEAGQTITFNGGSLTTKKVYGALEFRYNELVGHVTNWTSSSRPLMKFFISFPFDVNVSDIFGLNSAYGDAYEIQMYDGAERARKGFFRGDGTTTFWKTLQPGDVMKANEGYCVIMDNDYLNNDVGHVWDNKGSGSTVYLYFPSAGNVGSIASTSQTISIPSRPCTIDRTFTTHQGSTREVNHINTDSHWNMMGVPIFDTHSDPGTSGQPGAVFATSGTDGDGNFNYFYEWNPSNNQYSIHTAVNYSFKCMHGYMVQYHGNVTFKTAAAPASVAARRAPQKENYQIELQVLNSNEEILNRTYVELRENACDTFELNEDVYMSYNNLAANIYTLAGDYDVAANVLSINNHTVPVGVEVTKAGTYKFTMPSNFSGEVTLLDTFTGESTNLALGDYEVELPKGTTEDRFFLKTNIKKVATAIDGISEDGSLKDGKAHKFIQNGVMYILQNGVLYDAQGKRVQ